MSKKLIPVGEFTEVARATDIEGHPFVGVWSDGVMLSADNGNSAMMPGPNADCEFKLEKGKTYRITVEEVVDDACETEETELPQQAVAYAPMENPGKKIPSLPDPYYVPVVDGKVLSHVCAETPDVALLLGMQHKYEGPNSQFVKMASRMLQIDTSWVE